jgi:hypothetical protein
MDPIRPWNGHEPITDALLRHNVAEVFDLALKQVDRKAATLLLQAIGAELDAAERLIAQALPQAPAATD